MPPLNSPSDLPILQFPLQYAAIPRMIYLARFLCTTVFHFVLDFSIGGLMLRIVRCVSWLKYLALVSLFYSCVPVNAQSGTTPVWIPFTVNGGPQHPVSTIAYDPKSYTLITFGGIDAPPNTNLYNDVWVLRNANGLQGSLSWQQLFPATPSGGSRTEIFGQRYVRLRQ